MKFKIGDKVRVKKDLAGRSTYSAYCSEHMRCLAGTEAIITDVYASDNYEISVDDGAWIWPHDMLEHQGVSE